MNQENSILYINNKLLLDDDRSVMDVYNMTKEEVYAYPNWNIVRNYDDFVDYIMHGNDPILISFDHDLGSNVDERIKSDDAILSQENWDVYHGEDFHEKTGYDCLKWLIDYCYHHKLIFPRVIFHTQNIVGLNNMKFYYINAMKHKMIRTF